MTGTSWKATAMRHAVSHYLAKSGGVLVTISSWAAQRGVTNPGMIACAPARRLWRPQPRPSRAATRRTTS